MNPYATAPSSGASSLIGLLWTGYFIYVLLVVGSAVVGAYINYRIIKAAVRNGTIEAINRTGLADRPTFIQGSSGLDIGAPLPPSAQCRGYGG